MRKSILLAAVTTICAGLHGLNFFLTPNIPLHY